MMWDLDLVMKEKERNRAEIAMHNETIVVVLLSSQLIFATRKKIDYQFSERCKAH